MFSNWGILNYRYSDLYRRESDDAGEEAIAHGMFEIQKRHCEHRALTTAQIATDWDYLDSHLAPFPVNSFAIRHPHLVCLATLRFTAFHHADSGSSIRAPEENSAYPDTRYASLPSNAPALEHCHRDMKSRCHTVVI